MGNPTLDFKKSLCGARSACVISEGLRVGFLNSVSAELFIRDESGERRDGGKGVRYEVGGITGTDMPQGAADRRPQLPVSCLPVD